MASAYSQDLRDRVIDAVTRSGMSRRAAAERFGVSESAAIKWVERVERSGSRAASRMGGYLRPKLEPHREFLEALRGEKSDITLGRFATGCWPGARGQSRHLDDEPLLPSPSASRSKKDAHLARERDRGDIIALTERACWRSRQKRVDASRPVSHRRDLDQNQQPTALRLGPAR